MVEPFGSWYRHNAIRKLAKKPISVRLQNGTKGVWGKALGRLSAKDTSQHYLSLLDAK